MEIQKINRTEEGSRSRATVRDPFTRFSVLLDLGGEFSMSDGENNHSLELNFNSFTMPHFESPIGQPTFEANRKIGEIAKLRASVCPYDAMNIKTTLSSTPTVRTKINDC